MRLYINISSFFSIHFERKRTMSQLCTMKAVTNLFHNRSDQGKTYRVQDNVAELLFPGLTGGMRQRTDNEEKELADFLTVDKSELSGPFFVDAQLKCYECGCQFEYDSHNYTSRAYAYA